MIDSVRDILTENRTTPVVGRLRSCLCGNRFLLRSAHIPGGPKSPYITITFFILSSLIVHTHLKQFSDHLRSVVLKDN